MNLASSRQVSELDRLLTRDEVAHLTSLSRPTVYRAIAKGDLPPPVKIGRASRWLASEVSTFLSDLSALRSTNGQSSTGVDASGELR